MDRSYLWTGSNTHWHCHIYAHVQKCSNKKIQITNTLKKCSKHLLAKNAHSLAPTNVMKISLTCQHTFRLLIWNLMSSLDEIWNSLPCMKGKEIPEQEAEHSKWMGGNFFYFSPRREISLYIYMCVCVCVCVYIYVCVCVYIYICF